MKSKMFIAVVVAVAMLASMSVFAIADTVDYPGAGTPNSTATGTVTVNATVNPKITLTITTPDAAQAVEFGAVDPGAVIPPAVVDLEVKSNKAYDLTKALAGQYALMGLTTSLVNQLDQVKGTTPFSDTYTIDVPWDTDPGDYSATVAYTVLQK